MERESKMNNILTPQTGDEQLDRAYSNMQIHVSGFESFEQFYNYFVKIVKTQDHEYLNKWLLKVLYVQMKQKHPFELLLDKVDQGNKEQLQRWLDNQLEKLKK